MTKALEWNDETFRDAGKVGVWTKADSVTVFDDLLLPRHLVGASSSELD